MQRGGPGGVPAEPAGGFRQVIRKCSVPSSNQEMFTSRNSCRRRA